MVHAIILHASLHTYISNTSRINILILYQIFHNVQVTFNSCHINQFSYTLIE